MRFQHGFAAVGILLILGIVTGCSPTRGRAREGREVIPTYPFGGPDPVPIMTRSGIWGNGSRLYPYTFIDEFSKRAVDREWTVVRLENPYIEISILPEVGGKIWGAVEKSTGREFIYTNHVLKFREVALRGPWTSGGIEFNFGIVGHTPAGAHPVDYILQECPDGGVCCVVGALDLPSRTRWSVKISVPPDGAYFETRALWSNPSPLHQANYVWMNGAVRVSEDLQYVFPGRFFIGHDFSQPLRSWPVDENGRDLSWYRNNDFGSYKSYFTVGEYAEYFGGYWHKDQFGFGHWARYDDIPGHKAWIWGLSRQGMIWENLLTDSDGQYTEPQAGRYLNQNDHGLFIPYTKETWREVWFPYKEIGPMHEADPSGVLHVERDKAEIEIAFCPLRPVMEDLVVVERVSGREVYRETLRLRPMEILRRRIPYSPACGRFEVRVGTELIFDSDPESRRLRRPFHFRNPSDESTEAIFQAAGTLERERSYRRALEVYLEVIKRDPMHLRALTRAAELCFRRAENERAKALARRALDISMYDAEANYVYGLISQQAGNLTEAKESLGWAARSPVFRSAAYCRMGEIQWIEGRARAALEYTGKALESDVKNLNALFLKAVFLRKLEKTGEAASVLANILEIDPLEHRARFELSLLRPSEKARKSFSGLIRSEDPHQTFLEIAMDYMRLNMEQDALEVLERAPRHPLVGYWTAYLNRERDDSRAKRELAEAGEISPLLVFPFRSESIPVFRWAAREAPGDWKPRYYLGLLLWGKERIEEANALFESCGRPEFAPLYRIRAFFLEESDPSRALAELDEAVRIDPGDWRNHHRRADFLNRKGDAAALAAAREGVSRFQDSVPLQVELVRALMLNRAYKEAAEILGEMEALPSEGATAIHGLFVECHLHLGLEAAREKRYEEAVSEFQTAKAYPENLGTGEPYEPDQRLQDYLTALCLDRMGRHREAERLFGSIRDYTTALWPETGTHAYIGGLVLRKLGPRENSDVLLEVEPPGREILEMISRLTKRGHS